MKAITLYTQVKFVETQCGKLWVRPGQEGTVPTEEDGLIEIQLDTLPITGKMYAKEHVSCILTSEVKRLNPSTPHRLFSSKEEAVGFIKGVEYLEDENVTITSDPIKLGSKWVVYFKDDRP